MVGDGSDVDGGGDVIDISYRRICVAVVLVAVSITGMFLYSEVSSPVDRSKRFTLSLIDLFIPTPTCGFSGKHSSQAGITRQD